MLERRPVDAGDERVSKHAGVFKHWLYLRLTFDICI